MSRAGGLSLNKLGESADLKWKTYLDKPPREPLPPSKLHLGLKYGGVGDSR